MSNNNTASTNFVTLSLSQVKRSPSYQFRGKTDPAYAEELMEVLEDGMPFADYPEVCLLEGVYWLTDGFHRVMAHEMYGDEEATFHVIEVSSEIEILDRALVANAHHGKKADDTTVENKVSAVLRIDNKSVFKKGKRFDLDVDALRKRIGHSTRQVERVTEALRAALKAERAELVYKLKDEGFSNRAIAKEIGYGSTTVDSIVSKRPENDSVENGAPSEPQEETAAAQPSASVVPQQKPLPPTETDEDFGNHRVDPSVENNGPEKWTNNKGETEGNTEDWADLPWEEDICDDDFDINQTDAAKLVSAKDAGDELDTKDKEAVKLEKRLQTIRDFFEIAPQLDPQHLGHVIEHLQSIQNSRA